MPKAKLSTLQFFWHRYANNLTILGVGISPHIERKKEEEAETGCLSGFHTEGGETGISPPQGQVFPPQEFENYYRKISTMMTNTFYVS